MDLILDVAEKEMVGIYWLLTLAIWHFLTIIELQKRHDISYLVALIQKIFPQIYFFVSIKYFLLFMFSYFIFPLILYNTAS